MVGYSPACQTVLSTSMLILSVTVRSLQLPLALARPDPLDLHILLRSCDLSWPNG